MRIRERSEVPLRLALQLLLGLCVVIAGLRLIPAASVVFAILGIVAFASRRTSLLMSLLILMPTLTICNSVLFPKTTAYWILIKGTTVILGFMLIASSSQSGRDAGFTHPFKWLYVYLGYMVLAAFYGWCPAISLAKLALFSLFIAALLGACALLANSREDIRFIRAVILAIACFYLLGSVLVIPFPFIGQSMMTSQLELNAALPDMGLFNGLTWHSQALGPLVAVLNAFLLSDLLSNIRRGNPLYYLLMAACPVLIFISSSRTAMIGYLVSVMLTLFFYAKSRHIPGSKKSQVFLAAIAGAVVLLGVMLARPGGTSEVNAFLRKTSVENVSNNALWDDMTSSRMGLVDEAMANFRKSPLLGNGFQVSRDMADTEIDSIKQLLSAPVEKGFLPSMILEEGGVIGACLFLCFLASLYGWIFRKTYYCFGAVFGTFLAINLGEANWFSASGDGGVLWAIVFAALLMDVRRLKQFRNDERMMVGGRP